MSRVCVRDVDSRRAKTLWWSLVAYFRAYPPLVQSHGDNVAPGRSAGSKPRTPGARPAGKTAWRIRIYW